MVRTTRDIEILAHDWGFRVWDGYRPGEGRPVPPGDYVAEIQTRDGRIFGRTEVEIR